MRTTIVPAQITTVEDKIAGSLNLTQIILLLMPIFIGSVIYILFPPYLHFAAYKLILIIYTVIICVGLALRYKGKIVLQWLGILLRYNTRPRYFISDKNDDYLREVLSYEIKKQDVSKTAIFENEKPEKSFVTISLPDIVKLEELFNNPKANLSYTRAKKGGIRVSLSEIK